MVRARLPGATALLLLLAAVAPCAGVPSRVRGREILAGDEVLVFKGVNWNPVAVGKTQSDGVDFRGFVEADSALMAAAGINVIRTYSPIMDREVLDILWRRRIHVLNTVYVAAGDEVKTAVKPVQELKDHPAILMWCIGNEWNYNHLYSSTMLFDDALRRVAEVSKLIKSLDSTHLVATIYGMLPPPDQIETLSDVDVWGLTAYTGISFGSLFDLWGQRSRKPMFLAEFGADAYNAKAKVEDEAAQAHATTVLAQEISKNSVRKDGVCSGGLLFELADEWWKDGEGSPDRQDVGGIAPGGGPYPDHVFNEEYWGLVKIDGSPRHAFGAYAALPPAGTGADKIGAGFRLRACGSSPDCKGMLGDCCPTRTGKLLGCCSAEARLAAEGGPPESDKGTEGQACAIEHNYDYLGDDLQSIRHVGSTESCAKLCSASPVCKSFTYGKVGYFERTCFLKRTEMPGRRADPCCDSGLPCSRGAEGEAATTSALLPSTTALQSTTVLPTQPATTPPPAPATTPAATTAPAASARAAPEGAAANGTARTSKACEIERDHDYIGDDLDSIMYVASAETCATLCSAHPSCKSFTYVKLMQGCFLKSAVRPGRRSSDCCDSGLPCAQACLMEHNYDYSGDDFAGIGNVDSAETCARLCGRNPLCRSFTYSGKGAVCYLKKSVMPGRTASACCDSGLPCAQAPPPEGRAQGPPSASSAAPAGAPTTEAPEREGDWVDVQVTSRHEFVASISVGSPPQELRCLIDSGSADLWIPSARCRTCGSLNTFEAGSSKSFAPEDASTPLGGLRWPKSVKLSVGVGDVMGYPVRDTVRLGSLQVKNQSFIIVEDSTMPPQRAWDGICGLGWRQLGKVHHPLYSRIQEQGQRALFALVPRGPGRASLVVGAVPHSEIEEGTLVWVQAQSFQPGTMSQWVQRSFWVTTGGLRIHKITPASARFLIDTGVSEAMLAPPKHYSNFVNSLLPLGAFKHTCSVDKEDGGQVTCNCSILKEDLLPLQIHLGGQPFLMRLKDLFARVQVGGHERCRLQVRPNPKASSSQSGMLEGVGGLLGGVLPGAPLPAVAPEAPQPGPTGPIVVSGHVGSGWQAAFPPAGVVPPSPPPRPEWQSSLGQPLPGRSPILSPPTLPPAAQAAPQAAEVHQRRLDGGQDLLGHDLLSQGPQARGPAWAEVDDPMDELWVLGGKFVEGCVVIFDFDKALLGFARPASRAREAAADSEPSRAKPEGWQRLDEAAPLAAAGEVARPWTLPFAAAAFMASAVTLALVLGSCRVPEGRVWSPAMSYSSLMPPRRRLQRMEFVEWSEDAPSWIESAGI